MTIEPAPPTTHRFRFDPDLPLGLARLHQATAEGQQVELTITGQPPAAPDGSPITIDDVATGAGFVPAGEERLPSPAAGGSTTCWVRARSVPDWVGPDLGTLMIGLNPSPASAEHGVNFARPGNRFWPAALAAGLVTTERDPHHALIVDRVGFTDLVKRTTRQAAELDGPELAAGSARLARLVAWLQPTTCCVLGLTGWRAAVDRSAVAGWQPRPLGTRPVYLMPNPSGLNAHTRLDDFVAHFETVLAGP